MKKQRKHLLETLREDEMEPADSKGEKEIQIIVANVNGKKIRFDQEKQEVWPGEQFLRIHNIIFSKKRERNAWIAQAEAQEMIEEGSNQTITEEIAESIIKVKDWNDLSVGRTKYVNKCNS